MMLRTKGEQKAYLDGYEMCAECIEKYLTDEGKQKLEYLLTVVRNAVEIEAIGPQEQEPKWTPVSEPPKEDGEYFVTLKLMKDVTYVSILSYSHDLYSVDKFDFFDFADKKRPGWYDYSSEWGYYEMSNVIAWMPLPKPYKAESEKA